MNTPRFSLLRRHLATLSALVLSLNQIHAADAPANATATTPPAATPATTALVAAPAQPETPRPNTAIIPRPSRAMPMHDSFVEIAKKGDTDVLFLGDSITDWWREEREATHHNGKQVFDKYFGDWKVANFGIAGETTQQVLWRLQNGEGEGIQPKVVMLMIGTNNLGRATAPSNTNAEIVEGIGAVVAELRKDFPNAKILLLGIFPRFAADGPDRVRIADINQQIAKLNDLDHVFYLDIGQKFLEPDGTLTREVMWDGLHPTPKGYEIWAEAVKEPLVNLLKIAPAPAAAAPAAAPAK